MNLQVPCLRFGLHSLHRSHFSLAANKISCAQDSVLCWAFFSLCARKLPLCERQDRTWPRSGCLGLRCRHSIRRASPFSALPGRKHVEAGLQSDTPLDEASNQLLQCSRWFVNTRWCRSLHASVLDSSQNRIHTP